MRDDIKYLECSLQDYHLPTALDIPVDMRVTLLPNSVNSSGILRAKGKRIN